MNKYILLVLSLLLFITSTFVGLIIYKMEKKKKYSFLNMFPFELKNDHNGYLTLLFRILLAITIALLSLTSMNLFFFDVRATFIIKAEGIILLFTSLIMISLFILSFKSVKAHIIASSFFSTMVFISYLLFGYITVINHFELFYLYQTILAFIGSLIELILIFLPSLRNWFKMGKKKENEEGYIRSKFNTLSILEWSSIILYILLYILITVSKI